MSFINEQKQKLLDSSDTYNYHKNIQERHTEEIKELRNELKEVNKTFKKVNKRFEEQEKVLDSYNQLFNVLYLDYEITPKGTLKYTQDLCVEFLNFVANICKKYGLEYWIDYGNLIGAVRHGGYIPWDDDIDLGMMRADYDKFYEVIADELKNYGLDKHTSLVTYEYDEKKAVMFIQLKLLYKVGDKTWLLAGIDIFPYDYTTDSDLEVAKKTFKELQPQFRRKLLKGMTVEEVLDEYYEKMGVTYERQDHVIPALENTRGPSGVYEFSIIDTDFIFPLSKIKFGENYYSCPNNCDEYLRLIYGDYTTIHKVVHIHDRVSYLKTMENGDAVFEEFLELMKDINAKFE